MKRFFFTFVIILTFLTISLFIFEVATGGHKCVYKTTGSSNGDFLTPTICMVKVDPYSMKVGEFPIRKINGKMVAHPIIEVIKIDGKVIGYYTKGIENDHYDPILPPLQIEGRALRILEDGSVEEDTKWAE